MATRRRIDGTTSNTELMRNVNARIKNAKQFILITVDPEDEEHEIRVIKLDLSMQEFVRVMHDAEKLMLDTPTNEN